MVIFAVKLHSFGSLGMYYIFLYFYFYQAMATAERENLKKTFENVSYFTATSDVWSRSNVSFIAVTVHYFESKNLDKVQSKFIACEHFPGRHTHDRVATKLRDIFKRYGILDRVYYITTDGAGEFTAAFKNYGPNYRNIPLFDTSENDFDFLNVSDDSNDGPNSMNVSGSSSTGSSREVSAQCETDSDSDDDPDQFERANDRAYYVYDDDDDEANPDAFFVHDFPNFMLANMNRIDCAAHKLDKLGKDDAKTAESLDAEYDDLHERVFTKLKAIWNLKESRLNAEVFFRITGKKLVGPHRIRWMKTHEAVSFIFG